MTITIRTDKNIHASETTGAWIEEILNHDLSHFSGQLTRVEVHLADENGPKASKGDGGGDKRCTLDAKVDGMPNFAASAYGDNLDKAVRGAASKLKSVMGTALDKRKGI